GVFALVALGGGLPLVARTFKEMAQGRFYVDTVASLAILGAVTLGEWTAGALVVLMQSGGEALEDYGLRRANRSLDNLLKRAPSGAHRKQVSAFIDVPAAERAIGDTILGRPGAIPPTCGIG